MITLLLILLSLLLGYGLGFFHSSYLERRELDFPYIKWWNPLLLAVIVVAFIVHWYQEGWKATVENLKESIKELNDQ